MAKPTKENLTEAVQNVLHRYCCDDNVYLYKKNGHEITNEADYCLIMFVDDNGEIVIKDVYPGKVYARVKVTVELL